jgi:nicotinate dehydrogenase subunit A
MHPQTFTVAVNGVDRTVTCDPRTRLLYALRNDWSLAGSKFGCGEGECGSCLVLVNGVPEPSCQLTVRAATDHQVTSIEGLADDRYAVALRRALIDEQAAQCGYCISGIVVSAVALLRSTSPPLTRVMVERALAPNLCRCGSHNRVIAAVLRVSDLLDA